MVPPYYTVSCGWKTRRWKRLYPGEQGESLVPPYTRGSYLSLVRYLCLSVYICLKRCESRAGGERFQRLELFVSAARIYETSLMPPARRVLLCISPNYSVRVYVNPGPFILELYIIYPYPHSASLVMS